MSKQKQVGSFTEAISEKNHQGDAISQITEENAAATNKSNGSIMHDSCLINTTEDAESETNAMDDSNEAETVDENPADVWDLKKILSKEEMEDLPRKCKEEDCNLLAAVVWVSGTGEQWHGCLDCQYEHFGGWPETQEEIPLQYMTQDHKDHLIRYCSTRGGQSQEFPVFLHSPPEIEEMIHSDTVATPPPQSLTLDTQTISYNENQTKITPSPSSTAKQPKGMQKSVVMFSKKQIELHRQWQEAAIQLGGPNARIVLDSETAKKKIFDFLYDAFKPMNITQIYNELKAVIPKGILKNCLDDMALDTEVRLANDTDDEDCECRTTTSTAISSHATVYKNVLIMKAGKGTNTNIYYVNYNTAKNGDGLDREAKNKIAADWAAGNTERADLEQQINIMQAKTLKLLSEPTNEEASMLLKQEEATVEKLNQDLDEARKLKVNENYKLKVKRRIENMATMWRKRKRICMDFLIAMEEITDGMISVKKCLAGDGQIEIDSDQVVTAAMVDYTKKKLSASQKRNVSKAGKLIEPHGGFAPCQSFVGVLLSSNGRVQRVHVEDNKS